MKKIAMLIVLTLLLGVASFADVTYETSEGYYPTVESQMENGNEYDADESVVHSSNVLEDLEDNPATDELSPTFAEKRCGMWVKESSYTNCEKDACSGLFFKRQGTIVYTWWKRECTRYKDGFTYTEYDLKYRVDKCSC